MSRPLSLSQTRRLAVQTQDAPTQPTILLNLLTYPTHLYDSCIVAHGICLGNPGVKDRPRFVKKTGAVFTPQATKDHERDIGWAIKAVMRVGMDTTAAFGMRLVFYVQNAHRKDIDNMIKVVCDGITGIAWEDDSQVKELMAWIFADAAHPRTEMLIYKLEHPHGPLD